MIAIRSRVEALACTERNHPSSVTGVEARRDRAAVHGSATGTCLLIRSNRHWIRETSNSSIIDSRGMVLR